MLSRLHRKIVVAATARHHPPLGDSIVIAIAPQDTLYAAELICAELCWLGWYSRASSAEWSRALFSHGHHPAKPCPSSVVNCVLQRYNSNKTIMLCSSTARIDIIKAAQVSHQISFFTPRYEGKKFASPSNMVLLDEAKLIPTPGRSIISKLNFCGKFVLINWA